MARAKAQQGISSSAKKELWDQIVVNKKTQTYIVKETGAEETYTFWLASWEVPKDRLPEGAKRKRITASGGKPITSGFCLEVTGIFNIEVEFTPYKRN